MDTNDEIPQNIPQQTDQKDAEAKRAQEAEMRRNVLATVLDTAARERLSRIALVSPERSNQIEAMLLRMAQTGQLRGRVSENQLIDLLEQLEDAQGSQKSSGKTTIVYQRRKDFDDDLDF